MEMETFLIKSRVTIEQKNYDQLFPIVQRT